MELAFPCLRLTQRERPGQFTTSARTSGFQQGHLSLTKAAATAQDAARSGDAPPRTKMQPNVQRPTARDAGAVLEPEAAARAANLNYTNDTKPGISRQPGPDGFVFLNPDGSVITNDQVLSRIRKLAIPPAYKDVWICRDPNGHLQAVGRDAKGRKQYRYHARWRAVRDESKYGKMLIFGRQLPVIRAQVERDIARPGLPREKVIAALIRLLERTLMRVGNEEYARTNKSFGLTTLRRRHLKLHGNALIFDFRAKHGIAWHVELKDRRLANIVRRLQDISGQDLFKYVDDDGTVHTVGSDDVNDYLREITGEEITAKDFRTWAATNLAALALRGLEADTDAKAKKNMLRAVESVAKMLGNTPSICRKCYIHPAIFEGYLDGTLLEGIKAHADSILDKSTPGLTAEELAVMAYLDRRLSSP
jgi:DNA topoisomerase-1